MKNEINFGIGFVTGRSNVCNIINTYYKNILEQKQRDHRKIAVTIYVLYDLTYQNLKREEFYNIKGISISCVGAIEGPKMHRPHVGRACAPSQDLHFITKPPFSQARGCGNGLCDKAGEICGLDALRH